ncbi:hypothetical protein E8E12_008474 [Didymella heteroderae]|uniref:Uncharacterized protein n=1 Tax=Didymella heteroderae TaxID=1769908 RepID=A0A9P5C3F5_9PLEO|nr:hypothetical protein E8E12_008474 [Didymella heteroderae]
MASSHEHHQKQFLPPSPPPSPPAARRRHKKHHDDEFAKLAATPLPSPTLSATFGEEEKPEPLLKRSKIILTPVLFTSFLLSLFFVNAQNRARRTAAHTPPSSYLTYLFPPSWFDPEPYQDQSDSTWGRRGATGHVEPNDAIAPKDGQLDGTGEAKAAKQEKKKRRKESWHLNKKIRKIARLEVSDAFENQGRMIVVMTATLANTQALLRSGSSGRM